LSSVEQHLAEPPTEADLGPAAHSGRHVMAEPQETGPATACAPASGNAALTEAVAAVTRGQAGPGKSVHLRNTVRQADLTIA